MKLALIGFGQAGGKVVDEFLAYDEGINGGFIESAIAVNSATTDLKGLENIPQEDRVLIGQARVKGHGVGADNELGAIVTEEDIDEIQGAIDRIPIHEIDAFLIVAGMGGGTGSGGAPVLATHLKRIYSQPVFGLGILPAMDEGGIYTLNAARSFQTFVREVDNLLVFDNDVWRSAGESVADGYSQINRQIVERFGLLFAAGEVGQGDQIAESVVDSSEIINTLQDGVSTIGYASETVNTSSDGILASFREDTGFEKGTATNRITSLVRKAALGQLTLPCDVGSADRGLVVATGPPEKLSRKGVERGRQWLEDETGSMEIRGGDYPMPHSDEVGAIVLLSGITDVPRIDNLQQVAIEAQNRTETLQANADDELASLVDTGGELDALF
ncbi:cell division protein [Natrinema sp. CBA1119]|uniref:tubulin/FtsZ family protein n=1 Tax=Natrinema sp. CBA1119 TaxID=1608465 RepID=UPI000BFA61B7|nr:tubulin/FtsZ family protein [Natrinema sp. CBA1119]PGF18368.1 cell division protein [Natrinema sp. CBA1119]